MAKLIPDAIIDEMLGIIATGTELTICSTQPTTYTEAHTTYKLADVALTAGAGNGDWSLADGDTSGRKLTLAAQNAIDVDTTGTAEHYAITLPGSSKLLLVGTVTSQGLTQGNTVNFPATDVDEIRDVA